MSNRLSKNLKVSLEDDQLADINLVGDDGIKVPAFRLILACSSPVFKKMLFGEFQEANITDIHIPDTNSKVLKALVEYTISEQINKLDWEEEGSSTLDMLTDYIGLAILCHQYEIEGIEDIVRTILVDELEKKMELVCPIFSILDHQTCPQLHLVTIEMIVDNPRKILTKVEDIENSGITCLSPSKVKEVIDALLERKTKNNKGKKTLFLFERIVEWYRFNCDKYHQGKDICSEATKLLDLHLIDPYILETIVKSEEFVDNDQLMNAFMAQAKFASRYGMDYSKNPAPGDRLRLKYPSVSVLGSGDPLIDGFYLEESNSCFRKRDDDRHNRVYLKRVNFRHWKICANGESVYEWKNDHKGPSKTPVTGWVSTKTKEMTKLKVEFFGNDDDYLLFSSNESSSSSDSSESLDYLSEHTEHSVSSLDYLSESS